MPVKFSNNAETTLSSGVTSSATSITVADGSVFPSISGSEYFYATLVVDTDLSLLEVVKVTARSGNTLTVTRAQDGTSTRTFNSGDRCELRLTAAGLNDVANKADTANVTASGALMDSELTDTAAVKALNQGVATTDSPSFVNLTLSGTGSVKVPSGTTAQRDGSPANGMFRYNSTNEQFEGYQSGAWGAIGGGGGSNTFTADTFTGNGSTTAYALSQVINSEDNLLVFIAGVFQQQSAYSIATASGTTTLTFATAPANTREIIVYSVASAVSGTNLNIDSMTGDGSDTTLSLSINPVNENNTQVFIDGVYQNKDTYSISGTTLTFSTAPPTGSAVEVMTMTQTEINVPVDGTITPAKIASGDFYFNNNLLVGKTNTTGNVAGISLRSTGLIVGTVDNGTVGYFNRTNGDGTVLDFRKDNSAAGSISVNSSGTTYNTTSDSRLKDNIETITDGTNKLMAMNPVTHTWKADSEAPAVHGFIAQEMQNIVPEAVSGDPDGDEMMSMDYGRITPVLVAALQDAHKKIAELETRLNELEGR